MPQVEKLPCYMAADIPGPANYQNVHAINILIKQGEFYTTKKAY
jgi:hypothetical protein